MIVEQVVTVLQLENLLVLRRVNILGLCAEILELCIRINFLELDWLLLLCLDFRVFGEISYLCIDELRLLLDERHLLYTCYRHHPIGSRDSPQHEASLHHFSEK